MGGDHTITLPLLRSMNRAYGPVTVIHFDSHLDTWRPKVFGGAPSKQASINQQVLPTYPSIPEADQTKRNVLLLGCAGGVDEEREFCSQIGAYPAMFGLTSS